MKIIAFVNNNSGPAYHRVIAPLMLMNGVDVYITNNLLEEDFKDGCDIFMYNRIIPDHCAEMLARLKERHGFKTCVDVDDYWHLDREHILHDFYDEYEYANQQIWHIKNADIVTTTHDRLAEKIKEFNPNVHVLPNAIPKRGQFDIERQAHHLTRLFWQGSITHGPDINLLQRPMECLQDISKQIKMVMAGFMEEDEWYKMLMDYTAKTKHQYQILPGVNVNEYYQHYAHADICLIPLLNSTFNQHKSNLKVLEAANLGLPVICSPVHPYIGLPVVYAAGTKGWITNIKKMVASKRYQKEAGQELKEYCELHYNFDKINKERKQIFEYETSKQTVLR